MCICIAQSLQQIAVVSMYQINQLLFVKETKLSSSKYELNLGTKYTSVSVFKLLLSGKEPVVPAGNGAG